MITKVIGKFLQCVCCISFLANWSYAGNNSGAPFTTWPDTGLRQCYGNDQEITCPTPSTPFFGQDAQYVGTGRSYTKLDSAGQELPDSADDYAMVRDNVTGLIWEIKRNLDYSANFTDPHDADNTYSWCDQNSSTNGGAVGTCGASDTQDFISQMNQINFGGHNDWRLPSIKELATLIDRGRVFPPIDPIIKNVVPSDYYWTSTTHINNVSNAWTIYLGEGSIYEQGKTNAKHVIAVRGGKMPSSIRYVDNGDGTIIDNDTCLQWERATLDKDADGEADQMTWEEALVAAESLGLAGKTDWRLPNVNELISIVDYSMPGYQALDGYFDRPVYPSPLSYWSSTSSAYSVYYDHAFIVEYGRGSSGLDIKSSSKYVRAVRGQQCGSSYQPENPGSLEVTAPETVHIGQPFQLTIRKLDGSGKSVGEKASSLGINGAPATSKASTSEKVYLSSTCGPINPSVISLNAGSATSTNTFLYSPANSCNITAQLGQIAGKTTNPISVNSTVAYTVSLKGKVLDSSGQGLLHAIVKIEYVDGAPYSSTWSDVNGNYEIGNLTTGIFNVFVTTDTEPIQQSAVKTISLSANINTLNFTIVDKKPPVLLVPGLFGTDSTNKANLIPELPKRSLLPDRSKLKIHDPGEGIEAAHINWQDLRDELRSAGFAPIDCPWDWRKDPGDPLVWHAYLMQAIDEAKKLTGYDKVDIVAHSMGGILVRAYIVSSEYRNDIGKFIMVGTPNQGTALAYPVWEGGDPIYADNLRGSTGPYKLPLDYFYSQALNKEYVNWKETPLITFTEPKWINPFEPPVPVGIEPSPRMEVTQSKVRTFIHDYVPLLKTVVPYENCFLQKETSGECKKVELKNADGTITSDSQRLLPYLNKSENIAKLKNNVETIILLGSDKIKTINKIYIKQGENTVYEQGSPDGNPLALINGDGLTTASGLKIEGIDEKNIDTTKNCDHSNLLNCYRADIVTYLSSATKGLVKSSGDNPISAPHVSTAKGDVPDARLNFGVDGDTILLVIGPDGKRNGMNIDGEFFHENESVEISRSMDGMFVRFTNAIAGDYQVNVASQFVDKQTVSASMVANGNAAELDIPLFVDGTGDLISLHFDPTSANALTDNAQVFPPQNLLATNKNGKTSLAWEKPNGSGVSNYRLYNKDETQAFFTLLAAIPGTATSFLTTHPFSSPRRLYCISAVDKNGKESILSDSIDNEIHTITQHGYSLSDAIIILKILSGQETDLSTLMIGDKNGDNQLGMPEAIEILNQIAQ
jgi:pimeloyl-ACP methyl ester carboxylesterase